MEKMFFWPKKEFHVISESKDVKARKEKIGPCLKLRNAVELNTK